MTQMNKHYESEFKKIVRLHLEEGRTLNNANNLSDIGIYPA